jgi:hypothetical protein
LIHNKGLDVMMSNHSVIAYSYSRERKLVGFFPATLRAIYRQKIFPNNFDWSNYDPIKYYYALVVFF